MAAYILAFFIFCCTGLVALLVYFANDANAPSQRSSPWWILFWGCLTAAAIAVSHSLADVPWW